jgi:hypothetical protein
MPPNARLPAALLSGVRGLGTTREVPTRRQASDHKLLLNDGQIPKSTNP